MLISWIIFLTSVCHALVIQQPHIEVELVSEYVAYKPGSALPVAIRMKMDRGWHTYWKNPGDSGEPAKIEWILPRGFSASPISWPYPKWIEVPPLVNFGYVGEVFLLSAISSDSNSIQQSILHIQAKTSWLVCEEKCIPGKASLSLTLPISAEEPEPSRWKQAFEHTRRQLPQPLPARGVSLKDQGKNILIESSLGQKLTFFPEENMAVLLSMSQRNENHTLIIEKIGGANLQRLQGVLVTESGDAYSVDESLESPNYLGKMLIFALIGGLLLNLMPCVFPVLSIKILGFVQQSGKRKSHVLRHGLIFAAGILISFWMLAGILIALIAAGEQLGWGFQLQSPLFIVGLIFLFFFLGLNLLGCIDVGASFMGLGSRLASQEGELGTFFSGFLATAVASPCSAPFMGTAVGFALTQSPWNALLIFTSLAVGLALPYAVLSASPTLLHRLPKPGPWMETFRELMAFPLFATVVWLLSIFGAQTGTDGAIRVLFALVGLSAALWILRQLRHPICRVVAIALIAASLFYAIPPKKTAGLEWEKYSPTRLSELRTQNKPVFINFTAAWCVTCQVNDRLVFRSQEIANRFKDLHVVALKADWTNEDPDVTALLNSFGRSSVPFYVLYPPASPNPILLPEVLTKQVVFEALEKFKKAEYEKEPEGERK